MDLHPKVIGMHIADTTATECRRRRGHRFGLTTIIAATFTGGALLYFVARAVS